MRTPIRTAFFGLALALAVCAATAQAADGLITLEKPL